MIEKILQILKLLGDRWGIFFVTLTPFLSVLIMGLRALPRINAEVGKINDRLAEVIPMLQKDLSLPLDIWHKLNYLYPFGYALTLMGILIVAKGISVAVRIVKSFIPTIS